MLLVCYDIASSRRRQRVARLLDGYGVRVQKSVVECHLDAQRIAALRRELRELIDPCIDKVRFYWVCEKDRVQALAWDRRGRTASPALWLA